MKEETMVTEIETHIKSEKSGFSKWYVGITDDVVRRLFNEHNVSMYDGWWIYRIADSKDDAGKIEMHFINKGCQGAPGGGDEDSIFVYAYLITNSTNQ